MNAPVWLCAAVLAAAPASAGVWNDNVRPAGANVPRDFDSYSFAMVWEPAFCEGRNVPECADQRPAGPGAIGLSLHGLWPDKNDDASYSYAYCGASADARPLDRRPSWCQIPVPLYSPATRAALTAVMPGVASCLDHHEWAEHGSCTGLSADEYFAQAAAFVQRIADSAFGRYLAANAGRAVDAGELVAAFEKDFGPGSADKLNLQCTEVRGSPALLAVNLRLTKALRPASELSAMLLPTYQGNCPSSFLLVSAAPR